MCGTTHPLRWQSETWWWSEEAEGAIVAKRHAFNAWKVGKGTKETYCMAKRIAKHMVHIDPKSLENFYLANQMRRENVDVLGDKPIRNDAGEMSLSEEAKQKAWLEHYDRLLNVEFEWDPEHLFDEPPLEGPPISIIIDMVKKAISKMKSGKAAGPLGVVVEMNGAAGDTDTTLIRNHIIAIIQDGKVPADWEQSFIVCLLKGKGDALDRGNL